MLAPVDMKTLANENKKVIDEIRKNIYLDIPVSLFESFKMLHFDAMTAPLNKELCELFQISLPDLKNAIKTYKRNEMLENAIGGVPKNEYEFVNLLLEKWQTKMTYLEIFSIQTPYEFMNQKISENELNTIIKDEKDRIFVRTADPKTNIVLKDMIASVIKASADLSMKYSEQQIMRGLDHWIETNKRLITARIQSQIMFDKSKVTKGIQEWQDYINAITDVNKIETEAVMKHFIWQIKRKMFNLPVTNHIMPVFVGQQRIGKSTNIKQLCKPISDFTVIATFKDITDNRSHDIWNKAVLILDEMGFSTQSNIEDIKQKITSDSFSSRVLGTNRDTVIINKTTMIGTSNKDLSRLIFDDTGMRRFFQVTCKAPFDWHIIDKIDYLSLWQSINENDVSPLENIQIRNGIEVLQNSKRYQSLLEVFLLDRDWPISAATHGEVVGSLHFFEEFQLFEKTHQPHNEMTLTKFWRDMVDMPNIIPNFSYEKLPRGRDNKTKYKLFWK